METFVIQRIGKPLIMFALAFYSVRYLTGSSWDGIVLGVIPLLLGAINIMTSLAYSFTAIAVIVAAVWSVVPTGTRAVFHGQVEQIISGNTASDDGDKTGGTPASKMKAKHHTAVRQSN